MKDNISKEIRRMGMDDKISILIQSSMENGVYYTHDKGSLLHGNCLSRVFVDKIKDDSDKRMIMKGVYISDDEKLYVHKNIIKKLDCDLFFCRDKGDIKKIKEEADSCDNFSFINIVKLNSMKNFFSKGSCLHQDHMMA